MILFSYQAKIKRQFKVEEESFWQEITVFNSDFSLRGNRDTVVESQTQTEILDLDREVESLYKGQKRLHTLVSNKRRISESLTTCVSSKQGLFWYKIECRKTMCKCENAV